MIKIMVKTGSNYVFREVEDVMEIYREFGISKMVVAENGYYGENIDTIESVFGLDREFGEDIGMIDGIRTSEYEIWSI